MTDDGVEEMMRKRQ